MGVKTFKFYGGSKRMEIVRGNTGKARLTFKFSGIPYEMEDGDVINFTVKRDAKSDNALIAKEYTENPFILHLEPSDTKPLNYGEYVYDVQLVRANGDTHTGIKVKPFVVTEEVS